MLRPGQTIPNLTLPTADESSWSFASEPQEYFTLIVFYRGLHCPKCKQYLQTLDKAMEQLETLGVNVVAVSCDTEERAQKARKEWGIKRLPMAYGFLPEDASKWGLFVSDGIPRDGEVSEPKKFVEPGIFLVKPDESLYACAIQSMPFARPPVEELLEAIRYIKEHDYPARGRAAA